MLPQFVTINHICFQISRRTLIKLQRRPRVRTLFYNMCLTSKIPGLKDWAFLSGLYKEYRRLKQAKENSCKDTVGRDQSGDTPEVTTALKVLKIDLSVWLIYFFLLRTTSLLPVDLCRNQNLGVPI